MDPVKVGGGGCTGVGALCCWGWDWGCFTGLTSQASSSKPPVAEDLDTGAGADTMGVGTASAGVLVADSPEFCWENAFGSTVSLVCVAGAGLPFRVLFLRAPPAPENSPPSPSASSDPFLPLRLYLVSRCRMILRISPSRSPRFLKTVASTSGSTLSSMLSLLNT